MRLPGFDAERALYRTAVHYKMAVGTEYFGGIAVPATVAPGPFAPSITQPICTCSKCYASGGRCVEDCTCTLPCPKGQQPNGCGHQTTTTRPCTIPTPTCRSGQTASCGICCPTGQVNCYGSCVDLSEDFNNCGACGNYCAQGQTCSNGQCVCLSGTYCYPEGCADLMTDPQNCGSCDNACGPGQSCENGQCFCPSGQAYCPPGGCTNLTNDPQNCGSCGNACEYGLECVPPGRCVCPSGLPPCSGACCAPGQTCCNGQCCTTGQSCFNGCCASNTSNPTFLSSNANYLLANCPDWPNCAASCQTIEDLTVTFQVGEEDMAAAITPCSGGSSTPNGGFSIQLNAYNPAGEAMQYVFMISGNQIAWQVQYWRGGTEFYSNPPGNGSTPILSLPFSWFTPNRIPAGYLFEIDLTTDESSANVTGGTFKVTDNNGHTTLSPFNVDASYWYPIVAFQVNIVGPGGCTCSEFSPGGGTITYEVPPGQQLRLQQLCVEGGLREVCSGSTNSTCETSNATYGPIGPPCCSSSLSQSVSFNSAITCPSPPGCCSSTCA